MKVVDKVKPIRQSHCCAMCDETIDLSSYYTFCISKVVVTDEDTMKKVQIHQDRSGYFCKSCYRKLHNLSGGILPV